MVRGRHELRARTVTRLLTDQHALGVRLHFVSDNTRDDVVPALGTVAYYCGSCDAMLMQGCGAEDALTCFECEARIPPDAQSCPSCGWTW